ncbi:MAG: phosphatidylinositol-specific phospholipase C domain-containing protein [Mycobacterium sp.]
MSVNNPRTWAAAVALGFALAGPQAFGTASADADQSDASPRSASAARPSTPRATTTLPKRIPGRPVGASLTRTAATVTPPVARAARSAVTRRSVNVVIPANPVQEFLADAKVWVDTFANLYPWRSGSILPPEVRRIFFNASPVAAPMQVDLDLAAGVSSGAIAFTAADADGNRLLFSVPVKGLPGGPERGTVTVDNTAGTFTYTPDEDFVGTDTFSYVVSDDTSLLGGHQSTATVTVFNNTAGRTEDIVGEFTVLTYNISDLPFPISAGAWPRVTNTPQIGSRINAFDIVNVQQDVAYHRLLIAGALFPDRTAPQVPTSAWPLGMPFSDGLNSLSAYDIESLDRQQWSTRPNLLNPGGFTYTRQHIPGGSSVDVYNVDTSGGLLTNDEIAQLSAFIGAHSIGRAVIVTGDFGQLYSDPGQTLSQFAAVNGLTDAWVQLEYGGTAPTDAPGCAYEDACEQPDKIFYRDAAPLDPGDPASSPVRLQALSYTNEGLNFLDAAGGDLSANRPQSVTFGYSVDAVGPMNVDLANWMGDLPALSTLPLTQLPIPGTHDSGSYGITPTSPWALTGAAQFGFLTELPGFLQDLIVKPVAAGWGKTQSNDLYAQFTDGIRYVDLRLTNEPDGQVYLEHGLRSVLFADAVDDIAAFATEHPTEALIIYIQGIHNFTPVTHAEVIAQMDTAFGSRMVPRAVGISATLADLWAMNKNVIVVYNNAAVVAADDNLWPDDTVDLIWPNVQSVPALFDGNENNLANRAPTAIRGMFGEPTPSVINYITGILTIGTRSNEEFMFNVHPAVQQWMRVDFKNDVNLVTTDWYREFWPAGSTFARDGIGAVYETLGPRLVSARGSAD